ncbi:MAG TPA: ABC transporter ATP-binding protein [Chitinophagaceae bacterium]|jgi:ABC-2 type transport system ATP-binding protein|nr:ABC transporter ATP-binding protein [Chitinophagaceae bacterium]
MSVLQAEQLSKQYNGVKALDNLNLSIAKHEIFCLLGQNGAGKTTAINLFLGFIEATSGSVSINGIEVKPNNSAARKFIAYIPEVVMLYGNLSGIENLEFFNRLAGAKYSNDLLSGFLSQVGLPKETHHNRVNTYSKGMRQKVAIAIALAKDADTLLMDEPTSGLDPKATQEFTTLLKEVAARGKTVLMATHDIFNAVNIGTAIGIMKKGSLVHTVATKDITANELQQLYLETI